MLHKFKIIKIKQGFAKNFLLIVFFLPLFAFTLHKEYYSLTKIDYNQKENSVQITMRLFTNDIELALNKQHQKTLEIGTSIESSETDALLLSYLNQKFRIAINGKDAPYQYLGKEFEKNEMFVYLEIPNIESIVTIEVFASMLIEEFSEQENIVKLHINKQNKSLILTRRNNKALLKF